MTGATFPPDVKEGINLRDGGICTMQGVAGCRSTADHHPNHRLNRGMGGASSAIINSPANGCAICGPCNIAIESIPELAEEARRRGVKLEQAADPTRVPMWSPFFGQWVIFPSATVMTLTGITDATLDAREYQEWRR